jgi:transposase InsO family protein
VPYPSCLDVEIAIAKLKKYKSPGSDQILAEFIKAQGETLVSVIHKLIKYIWNKEELPDPSKVSIIVPIHKNGWKLLGVINMGFDITDLILIRFSEFVKY